MYGSIATWRTPGWSVSRLSARAVSGAAANRLSPKLAETANPALANLFGKALLVTILTSQFDIDILVIYYSVYY
jgi:hypothetical protein